MPLVTLILRSKSKQGLPLPPPAIAVPKKYAKKGIKQNLLILRPI